MRRPIFDWRVKWADNRFGYLSICSAGCPSFEILLSAFYASIYTKRCTFYNGFYLIDMYASENRFIIPTARADKPTTRSI